MAYQATTYNVIIASPSDVAAERNAIRQILADWNVVNSQTRRMVLLPVGWETHSSPEMGDHPQKILNKQILERGDLLIGVFWTRLGTPTATHPSGSVEEIEEHLKSGKPAMIYFSNQPVRLDSVDSEQYKQLLAFKTACRERGLLEEYEDLADFREKFYRQLQISVNENPYFNSSTASQVPVIEFDRVARHVTLTEEAKVLLAAAAEGNGTVMRLSYIGGTDVQAGNRNFVEGDDRRTIALWEAAADELEREGLIEDKAGKREVYFVTHEGFRVADGLPSSE